MKINKIINTFVALLFTKKCLICEKEYGKYLCQKCFKKLEFKKQSCPNCQKVNKDGHFCKKCQHLFSYKGIMVAGDFKDKNLKKLIKTFKFNFIEEIGQYLGLFLLNFFENNFCNNPILKNKNKDYFNYKNTIIISVPLSQKRLKWRGFNQSEILAKIISSKTKIPIFTEIKRIKHRKAQSKLKKEERQINLKDCFEIKNNISVVKKIKGKKIIIIDDVATSGSTIEEISKEIKKYQASEVWGLVLSHA